MQKEGINWSDDSNGSCYEKKAVNTDSTVRMKCAEVKIIEKLEKMNSLEKCESPHWSSWINELITENRTCRQNGEKIMLP